MSEEIPVLLTTSVTIWILDAWNLHGRTKHYCEVRFFKSKRVNENLVFSVISSNTEGPVNSTADNSKSLSKNNSVEGIPENDNPLKYLKTPKN